MPQGKKGKSQSPAKGEGQAIATYFLAKHSGLFRPGAATILANSSPVAKTAKSDTVPIFRNRFPKSRYQGGGSGGMIGPNITPILDNIHWYLYGF